MNLTSTPSSHVVTPTERDARITHRWAVQHARKKGIVRLPEGCHGGEIVHTLCVKSYLAFVHVKRADGIAWSPVRAERPADGLHKKCITGITSQEGESVSSR